MSENYGYTDANNKNVLGAHLIGSMTGSSLNSQPSGSDYERTRSTVDQIAEDLITLQGASRKDGTAFRGSDVKSELVGSYSSLGGFSSALSNVEQAILKSQVPIELGEVEEITVNGQRGVWANKQESVNWKGTLPISQYSVNEDSSPEVITKRPLQQLIYQQEVAIRYLRPPTPPLPGEIIVEQEANKLTQPAPPLIIRQQPPRPVTPQPLVVREAPPAPPANVGRKVITISGKRIPPPPRKVIIERLAPLPSKPQSVIIERWLPYNQAKRRVIFQKPIDPQPILVKPKNVIIQWEAPEVQVKKEFKDLGVIRANPLEYVQRYGSTLKSIHDLPSFVLEIKPPAGVVLASDYEYNTSYELEGDVEALKMVDLDREGLGEYRDLVKRMDSQTNTEFIGEMFTIIDRDNNGKVSVGEAEKILTKLNSRLGRYYSEDEIIKFLAKLDMSKENFIDMEDFRAAFQKTLNK